MRNAPFADKPTFMQKHILFLAFIAVLVCQCRPDVIVPFEPFGSQRDELLTLLRTAIDTSRTTTFNLQNPTDQVLTFTTGHGSFVKIDDADNTFRNAQGQNVPCSACAEFQIKLREATTNNQIVANGLSAKASTLQVAETSGAVHLEVFCNGQALQIRDGANVNVTALTSSVTGEMDQYTAVLDVNQEQFDWVAQSGERVFLYQQPSQVGYEFRVTQTGWTTGFLPSVVSTQDICLEMDKRYNIENTFAYLVLDGQRAAIQMPFNSQTGKFCLSAVPKGVNAQLFVISRVGEEWKTQKQSFNTNDANVSIAPASATESEVKQIVLSL
jgi:hypothetical protein